MKEFMKEILTALILFCVVFVLPPVAFYLYRHRLIEHFVSNMVAAGVMFTLGIILSIVETPFFLIFVAYATYLGGIVIVVACIEQRKRNKTIETIARCDYVHTSFHTVGRSARTSFTIEENNLGGGYSGKIYHEPDTRETIKYFYIHFTLGDGQEVSFGYHDSKSDNVGKYGIIRFKNAAIMFRNGALDGMGSQKYKKAGYDNFEFKPCDNQEEGKAAFQAKKREASIYKRRKTKSRAHSLHRIDDVDSDDT